MKEIETLRSFVAVLHSDGYSGSARQLEACANSIESRLSALNARVAELEAKESRLRNAVEKISANPYWESASRFAEGYWQRYNNVIRTADEALKEPANEG